MKARITMKNIVIEFVFWSAIILMLSSLGCGAEQATDYPEPYLIAPVPAEPMPPARKGIWIDPASGIPQDAVKLACDTWRLTGLTCTFTEYQENAIISVEACPDTDCRPQPDGWLWQGAGSWNHACVRMACWPHAATDVDQGMRVAYVLAHELGHSFGLQHVNDGYSVMNAAITYRLAPTDADIREFHRVWGDQRLP